MLPDSGECPVCLENMRHVVRLGCNHHLCLECYERLQRQQCPLCRQDIETYDLFYRCTPSERIREGCVERVLPTVAKNALYDAVQTAAESCRCLFVTHRARMYTDFLSMPNVDSNHSDLSTSTVVLASESWMGVPLYRLYDEILYVDPACTDAEQNQVVRTFQNIVLLGPDLSGPAN